MTLTAVAASSGSSSPPPRPSSRSPCASQHVLTTLDRGCHLDAAPHAVVDELLALDTLDTRGGRGALERPPSSCSFHRKTPMSRHRPCLLRENRPRKSSAKIVRENREKSCGWRCSMEAAGAEEEGGPAHGGGRASGPGCSTQPRGEEEAAGRQRRGRRAGRPRARRACGGARGRGERGGVAAWRRGGAAARRRGGAGRSR